MKTAMKWVGILLGAVLGLWVIVVLVLYSIGQARLNKKYDIVVGLVSVPAEAEALAEGRRIFRYRGCEACHGEQLEGVVYLDNPALGQVITPNLTGGLGGIGLQRSDQDLIRSIKHGVGPDGTPLLFMPSTEFYYLSDEDLGKILAYIRSVPPVNNQPQPSQLSFTGFVVMNVTKAITFLPAELVPHDQEAPAPPEPGTTAEYGQYLSISCMVCHGPALSGGDIPGFPPEWPAPPNLTSGAGSRLPAWGEDGFIEIIRMGKKHGRRINPDYMPWTSYRHMTDDELRAVYTYLMSLPPEEFGNR
ncbi:MAG: cytochrome c [Anaerolineales bacterium]|nr:cytochrome c [Anaerolineales bacterium]